MAGESLLTARARRSVKPYLGRHVNKIVFDFDQGTPSLDAYPQTELKSYARQALDDHLPSVYEYFGRAGYEEMAFGHRGLRQCIAARQSVRDGRTYRPTNVLLTHGASQAISLLASAFLEEGDAALVEAVTFEHAVQSMRHCGATIASVPLDDDGMVVDELPRHCERLRADGLVPKLIYTIPTFQMPTGSCLPLERRVRLLELAAEHDLVVVEDACYNRLRYSGVEDPTLLSLDTDGRVVQVDSMSKILAPSLRLGWATGDAGVVQTLASLRGDLGVSQWISQIVHDFTSDGRLDEHVASVLPAYRRKRDLVARALATHCTPWVEFRVPDGGVFFWLELSPGVDWHKVRRRLAREGIACRPGERFGDDSSGREFLRLAFLRMTEPQLEEGVATLGRVIRDAAGTSSS